MRFIVNSVSLLRSLQSISGVINTKNTLPILDDFLFELDSNTLKITGSDLETTMSVSLDLEKADESGKVAIPARILIETLKTFANIPITFTVSDDDFQVELTAGEGKYKLSGHDAAEFPKTLEMDDVVEVKVPADVLVNAFNKTLFATGNDELRPVMAGVFCTLASESATFVATDAHKLVRYTRADVKSESNISFILPKKPLNLLKNVLPQDEELVTLQYSQKNAIFLFDNLVLSCKLVDGKYPNYEAVIPVNNSNKMTVDRLSLYNSIKRVSIYANQSTHQIRFKMQGQELILSAEDLDYSNAANERLRCNYAGEDMEIGFNSRFLLEMLSNLDTEEITFEMSAPNRAGLIVPVNGDNQSEDILMLIMPVMLN